VTDANASFQRAEELLERLRLKIERLEALASGSGDVDEAVDDADIAKEIEAEVQRARQAADAGA
jgi:phage shock protein A